MTKPFNDQMITDAINSKREAMRTKKFLEYLAMLICIAVALMCLVLARAHAMGDGDPGSRNTSGGYSTQQGSGSDYYYHGWLSGPSVFSREYWTTPRSGLRDNPNMPYRSTGAEGYYEDSSGYNINSKGGWYSSYGGASIRGY